MNKEEKSKSNVITFRVDEDIHLDILSLAARAKRSPSQIVRHIVVKYLQENPYEISQQEFLEAYINKIKSDIRREEFAIEIAKKNIEDFQKALIKNQKELEKMKKRAQK